MFNAFHSYKFIFIKRTINKIFVTNKIQLYKYVYTEQVHQFITDKLFLITSNYSVQIAS